MSSRAGTLYACWVGLAAILAPVASAKPVPDVAPAQVYAGSVQTERLMQSPSSVEAAFSPDGGAEALVLRVIGSAVSTIRLAGYSFTSPKVVRHLIDAKRRGVDVAIVIDAKGNLNSTSAQALNLLVNAGIPARLVDRYASHHDKYLVVDGKHVETGSYNFTSSAASRNSENVLVVWNNVDLAAQYLRHWQSRFNQGVDYRSSY
ncbi:phospholipase D family nuclease [Pandoraea commovens]|uniref:phospholipase D n=1 Tax=Pandoraea commovens TaxID=2508289 RepID=A0ABY5Q8M4_9BURK|nr:phospholipase D family protein [Pandoraea commovens]UVA77127.1 phospholipase D family protein [Pandoraea commovens]